MRIKIPFFKAWISEALKTAAIWPAKEQVCIRKMPAELNVMTNTIGANNYSCSIACALTSGPATSHKPTPRIVTLQCPEQKLVRQNFKRKVNRFALAPADSYFLVLRSVLLLPGRHGVFSGRQSLNRERAIPAGYCVVRGF